MIHRVRAGGASAGALRLGLLGCLGLALGLAAIGPTPAAASPRPNSESSGVALPSLARTVANAMAHALEGRGEPAATAPRALPASATEPGIEPPGVEPDPIPEGGFPYRPRPAPTPRELTHIVAPGESLDAIAERYGTDRADLIARNRLSKRAPRLKAGQKLTVFAERFPLPRLRVRYTTRPGDTWERIAAGYGMDADALRAQNPRLRRLRQLAPRTRIEAWPEAALPRLVEYGPWPAWDFAPTAPEGSQSYGHPHWGRLVDGKALPESPLYTIRTPDQAYASTHAMRVVQHAIAAFRHETGHTGEVLICGMSKQRGRRFPPHKSHQSGRDVDIGLVAFPGMARLDGQKAHGGEVDWAATWLLMRHLIETGEVTYIFLSYHLQPALYEAAAALGATDEELARTIQWPARKGRPTGALIRHARGHTAHFHVRVRCGADEPRCKGP